jgi:hypothetical protein
MKRFNKGEAMVEALIVGAFILIFVLTILSAVSESSDSSEAIGTLEGEEINQTYQPLPDITSSEPVSAEQSLSATVKQSFEQSNASANSIIVQGNGNVVQSNGSQILRTQNGDTSTEIIQEDGKQTLKITEGGKTTTIIQDENGTRTVVE